MFTSINVHNYLQELGIPHEIFKLSRPARSLEHAAAVVGLEPGQLACVKPYRIDGKPTIVIFPGDRLVDVVKLASVAGGGEVERVPADQVASLTGYVSGCVPPVGLQIAMDAFIDYYTLKEDVVYTGSGEQTAILKIRSYDLVRATGGETVDISSPGGGEAGAEEVGL
jgi:prolyl-tRNA editing enzyme YbaK/EbsC (Cys-tRNA(Pro) deacylase)